MGDYLVGKILLPPSTTPFSRRPGFIGFSFPDQFRVKRFQGIA